TGQWPDGIFLVELNAHRTGRKAAHKLQPSRRREQKSPPLSRESSRTGVVSGECMLSSSLASSEKQLTPAEDLEALLAAKADAAAERLVAPKGFQDKFVAQVEAESDKLATAAQGILVREFRQDLNRLVTTVRAMSRNIRADAHDVDEELALPSIV